MMRESLAILALGAARLATLLGAYALRFGWAF